MRKRRKEEKYVYNKNNDGWCAKFGRRSGHLIGGVKRNSFPVNKSITDKSFIVFSTGPKCKSRRITEWMTDVNQDFVPV